MAMAMAKLFITGLSTTITCSFAVVFKGAVMAVMLLLRLAAIGRPKALLAEMLAIFGLVALLSCRPSSRRARRVSGWSAAATRIAASKKAAT
ncbi:Os12g0238400 [Oryza sativa Japonica Group]|uniref:Os12g0238400 protein n=1 Tax=Oryza sativa subsp. japonica TaxID=39947 RepID=A0A0P0Y8J5_ORYSJ|nr:hypothetical protein EE612_058612 [Oryza sativa]BAT16488.1 Os12g0238400 [Oryza sativa Japonica Group]